MMSFYSINTEEKRNVLKEVSNRVSIPDFNVEKDWWVVQTLGLVFEMEIGKCLVFKGGTSLSKSWGVIERFSEDVDLAVDRAFFGFEGELNKSKRTKLRKESSKYIIENFAPQLQQKFIDKGIKDVEVLVVPTQESDQDPKLVEIHYTGSIEYPKYIKPRILLEIGCRSLIEPKTNKDVISILDDTFSESDFAQKAISIPSVNPERTFLEKIFLLHEEFQKPQKRSERMSRHLYDIYKLKSRNDCMEVFNNMHLYDTIVKHRESFTKIAGVDYSKHAPSSIDFIPPINIYSQFEIDYKEMQENMIYGATPSFEKLMDELRILKEKINKIKH